MKRRTKGTGTIVKIGDVYYGRINVKGKVKKVRLSKNQREATSLWNDWLKENVSTFKTESAKHPVDELWPKLNERYLELGRSKANIDTDKTRYLNLVSFFKKQEKENVEDITKADIISFIETFCEGLTDRTKRCYKYIIREMLKAANPNGKDLTADMKIRRTPTLAREPFTNDELKTILEAAEEKGHDWKVLIEVGLYTGLRLKDCVFLNSESVKEDVIETEPFKTKGRHGTIVRIPLHPVLKSELESMKVESGFYFPDIIALYKDNSSKIETRLRNIFKTTGADLKKTVEGRKRKVPVKGFHALRATFITRLAERGVSLPIMESLAGHLNTAQTMRYTHPDEDVKKIAVSVLPNFQNATEDEKAVFVHPEVQKVVDVCKKQIEETIEKIMGKKVEVQITGKEIVGGSKWFFDEL